MRRREDPKRKVQSWLTSLEAEGDCDRVFDAPPPAKRARINSRINVPFNAPSPPLTDLDADLAPMSAPPPPRTPEMPIRGRKRGMEDDDTDPDDTPTQANRAKRSVRLPAKSSTTGLGRSRAALDRLQKPLRIDSLLGLADAATKLPADILPLYKRILAADARQKIVPYEVREEMATIIPDSPWLFSDPEPTSAEAHRAKEVFSALKAILRKAADAQAQQRGETAWYIHVHSRLLDLVFPSDIPKIGEISGPRARYEPVMGATIAGNSIPFLRRNAEDEASEPACSVSLDSEAMSSRTGSSQVPSQVAMSQVRSHGVKVDFVVALDIPFGEPLQKAISKTIDGAAGGLHVNQTAYLSLKESPIAASFEMKTELGAKDPFVQLGIWAAAWYKRMYDLRDVLVRAGPKPRLVSIPLVQVLGHSWHVYCACDRGTSIEVYGPVSLGSTDSILSIYVLLRSLEAIKDWVKGAFCTAMASWFLCDEADNGDPSLDHSILFPPLLFQGTDAATKYSRDSFISPSLVLHLAQFPAVLGCPLPSRGSSSVQLAFGSHMLADVVIRSPVTVVSEIIKSVAIFVVKSGYVDSASDSIETKTDWVSATDLDQRYGGGGSRSTSASASSRKRSRSQVSASEEDGESDDGGWYARNVRVRAGRGQSMSEEDARWYVTNILGIDPDIDKELERGLRRRKRQRLRDDGDQEEEERWFRLGLLDKDPPVGRAVEEEESWRPRVRRQIHAPSDYTVDTLSSLTDTSAVADVEDTERNGSLPLLASPTQATVSTEDRGVPLL